MTLRKQSITLIFCGILFGATCHGAIPIEAEPRYLAAALAFQQSDFSGALSILDQLNRELPNIPEVLELRALTLQRSGKKNDARQIYSQLFELAKKSSPERAPMYSFELGLLHYQEKQWNDALRFFNDSLEKGHDPSACRFYLGAIHLIRKSYETARDYLEEALETTNPEFLIATRLHLAKLNQEQKHSTEILRHYVEARKVIRGVSSDEKGGSPSLQSLVKESTKTIDTILQPHEADVPFARIGTFLGYDSNVLSVPTSAVVDEGANASSPFGALRYAAGYVSSPVKDWQWQAAYNGSVNYELNGAAKAGQFLTNNINLQLIRDPLPWNNKGLQLSASGIMQSRENDAGELRFHPYHLRARLGPFARWRMGRDWVLGTGFFPSVTKHYLDDGKVDDQKKSGWDVTLAAFLASIRLQKYWNPTLSLGLGSNQSSGKEFKDASAEISLGNIIYFSHQFAVLMTIDTTFRYFYSRPEQLRMDQTPNFSASGIYMLDPTVSFFGQIKYTQNLSNISTYRYRRLFTTAGVNFTF